MIDLDRGVTKRIHPAGFGVCMYKDDPGTYYDTAGNRVSEKVAAEAGFPVKEYAKERERRERVAAALAEINAEYGKLPEGKVVYEIGGYKVTHVGAGGFVVMDPDDNRLTPHPMNKDAAVKLARKLVAQSPDMDPDNSKTQET